MILRRDIPLLMMLILLSCFAPKKVTVAADGPPALFGTYWKLVELNGTMPGLTSKEPHIVLSQSDKKVTGNGGCNSFFGTYQYQADGNISFADIGSTKMACPGLPVENEFFKTLTAVKRYSFKLDTLILLGGPEPVAKFVAVPKSDQ
jgi:heat shock protein HslJ